MCPAPKQEIKSQKKPRYTLEKRLTEEPPRKGTPSEDALLPRIPQSYRRTLHPLQPGKNQILAADVGKFSSGLEGGDDGPPDNVPAFAVPVIGTNAPDVVEHNGLALVLPYI